MAAPVEAIVIIDFGLSDNVRTGIIIAPDRHSNWDYAPRYREGLGYRPRYYPLYRRSQFYDSRYQNDRLRYRRSFWSILPSTSNATFNLELAFEQIGIAIKWLQSLLAIASRTSDRGRNARVSMHSKERFDTINKVGNAYNLN